MAVPPLEQAHHVRCLTCVSMSIGRPWQLTPNRGALSLNIDAVQQGDDLV
jgi:hypothetical protein